MDDGGRDREGTSMRPGRVPRTPGVSAYRTTRSLSVATASVHSLTGDMRNAQIPLAEVFKAGLSGAYASIVDGRTQSVQIAIPVHLQQLVKGIVRQLSRVRIPTH